MFISGYCILTCILIPELSHLCAHRVIIVIIIMVMIMIITPVLIVCLLLYSDIG